MLRRIVLGTVGIIGLALLSLAQAQEAGRREGQPAAQGEGRRSGWESQMRDRWIGLIKDQLSVSEAEWKALQPKLEKAISLQRDLRTGFTMRQRGGESEEPESKVIEAQNNLRVALADNNTPTEDIAIRLKAFREERDKARAELQAVQKELKAAVKPRQEAVLVLHGVLD